MEREGREDGARSVLDEEGDFGLIVRGRPVAVVEVDCWYCEVLC
jgi:hypothetical protein